MRNKEKISQLSKFANNLIFQAIIEFSLEFPTANPSLSLLLLDMFENIEYPKKIFFEISKNIECKSLLQFCRTFSVLNDDDLQIIDYIQSDKFFFQGPVFGKKSKDIIMENARKEKKEKKTAIIEELKMEKARNIQTIYDLNQELSLLKQKIESIEINKIILPPEIPEINKNKVCIELAHQYPILYCMINKFLKRPTSEEYYKFCSLIHLLNSKAYKKMCDFLPLLSISSCYYFLSPIKYSIKDLFLDHECIPNLISKFYQGIISFNEQHKAEKPILVTLGGDAASLKNFTKSKSVALYVFEMLPLMKYYPPCVVHVTQTRNGSSPKYIIDKFQKIRQILNKHNFIVKFQATDGDVSFDQTHRTFFQDKIEPILEKPFSEIIDEINKGEYIPVSDLFHILKCARSRIIQHLLLIDPETCRCVNTALFADAVQLGPVFSDKGKPGAMKDGYALAIFSWYSFVKCLEKGRFDAAFFILPYLLLIEAFRSPLLSNETRQDFLSYAFEIFKMHLKKIRNVGNNSVFKQRYSSKSLGVLFSDEISIIRILNTIVALSIAVKYYPDNLATQRVSTHDIELFFGSMRILSFYDNDYDNAVRVAAEAIIARQFSNDLHSPIKINKRENEAGFTLTNEINSLKNIDFDGLFLANTLSDLMNGKTVNDEILNRVEIMINNYTNLIISSKQYKTIRIPNLMRGTLPSHRYNVINYSLSVIPIPKFESTFDFYLKDKRFKKNVQKLSINEWCMKLCASLHGIDHKTSQSKFKIPFKYNLDDENDVEKLVNYLVNPLLQSKEYAEILKLKNNIDEQKNKKNIIFSFDLYDYAWENIINGKDLSDNSNDHSNPINQTSENNDDLISDTVLQNLNNTKQFKQTISTAENPKEVIKKAAKKAFIATLKKAMKTFIQIFREMSKEEFVSKFGTNLSQNILSSCRPPKNDQVVEDEHLNAINNYILENDDTIE